MRIADHNALAAWVLATLGASLSAEGPPHLAAPAEHPPHLPGTPEIQRIDEPTFRLLSTPSTEWTLHKTDDGAHPDGNEQQLMWLMNRARTDPEQEGLYLADTGNSQVESAVQFFRVDIELMKSELAAFDPKPPAAFDRRIYEGSVAHSQDLIARDAQDHNQQFDRVRDAGFSLNGGNASVFSFARDAVYAHAGFNIDWGGNDGTGMQTGRGHRQGIMAGTLDSTNVGIAMIAEDDPATTVGPLVTSIVYARARTAEPDHHNRFLVGTVWEDLNSNQLYDPGEGLGGVTVTPNLGDFYAETADSGGWAIPALLPGDYTLTFSGGDLSQPQQRTVTVGTESVLVIWNQADAFASTELTPPVARFSRLSDGGTVSWQAIAGQSYQLQVWQDTGGWTDDNRAISAQGDSRSARFSDSEIQGTLLVRVLSSPESSQ